MVTLKTKEEKKHGYLSMLPLHRQQREHTQGTIHINEK